MLHELLDPFAQNCRTTAILRVKGADGTESDVVSGGARDLSPVQRAALMPHERAAAHQGLHAESTALERMRAESLEPVAIVATRDFCGNCRAEIEAAGATIVDARAARWEPSS